MANSGPDKAAMVHGIHQSANHPFVDEQERVVLAIASGELNREELARSLQTYKSSAA